MACPLFLHFEHISENKESIKTYKHNLHMKGFKCDVNNEKVYRNSLRAPRSDGGIEDNSKIIVLISKNFYF